MAFTRINPGGWAANAQLTSAQINALDIDHANSLDKTVAGDTINGPIIFAGGGTGQITANLTATVRGGIAGGISARVAAGIQSDAVNGINLNGGANDNVTFPARTKNIKILPHPFGLQAGWTVSTIGFQVLVGSATVANQTFNIPHLINGATLATVKTWLMVSAHANVPANLPTLIVYRRTLFSAATADALVPLAVAAVAFPTPGSGPLWTASGNLQNWTYTTTQNNVIDTSLYVYYLLIADENGLNSVAGNQYAGFELGFTNITSYQASVG